jgi:hypothetical protein
MYLIPSVIHSNNPSFLHSTHSLIPSTLFLHSLILSLTHPPFPQSYIFFIFSFFISSFSHFLFLLNFLFSFFLSFFYISFDFHILHPCSLNSHSSFTFFLSSPFFLLSPFFAPLFLSPFYFLSSSSFALSLSLLLSIPLSNAGFSFLCCSLCHSK